MEVRFTVFEQALISFLPTGVEPVKVNFLTNLFEVISAPISLVFPVTILTSPFGKPALSAKITKAKADNGVAFAGLQTTAHPAASAGAIFLVNIAIGKFQGVMHATTPTGCLTTMILLSLLGGAIVSP